MGFNYWAQPSQPGFGARLGQVLGGGLQGLGTYLARKQQFEQQKKEQMAIEQEQKLKANQQAMENRMAQEQLDIKIAQEARAKAKWEAGADQREFEDWLTANTLEYYKRGELPPWEQKNMTEYQRAMMGFKYFKEAKDAEKADTGKTPTGLQSPLAVNIVKQMEDAANAGDVNRLHALFKQAELQKNQMGSVTTGLKGETIRTNPDYSKVVNRYKELVTQLGGQTAQPYSQEQKLVTAWAQAENQGSNALLLDLANEVGVDNLINTLYQKYGKERVDGVLKRYRD